MDSTQKQILEKLTQLINLYNAMSSNSKTIDELPAVSDPSGYYLAVNNGSGTYKTLYKPSEITKTDFDNLKNMQLGSNLSDPSILIMDGQGNILTTLNIDFITEDSVKYTLQDPTALQQQQARENMGIWLTSLYDESFVFNQATNPLQQFVLAFTPTQVDMVFDTNSPIWFDQGDFTVVGNVLTINYPMENDAIIKIKYWKYV